MISRVIKRTKDMVRNIPGNGLGFGLLKYLAPSSESPGPDLSELPAPEIGFNYLGRMRVGSSREEDDWDLIGGGVAGVPEGLPMAHVIEINAVTHDTPDGPVLHIGWTWAGEAIAEDRVRRLADLLTDTLTAISRHVDDPNIGGLSTSESRWRGFPWRSSNTSKLIGTNSMNRGNVLDILPLSPLQEGMLFHSVYSDHDASAPDVYTISVIASLVGRPGLRPAAHRHRSCWTAREPTAVPLRGSANPVQYRAEKGRGAVRGTATSRIRRSMNETPRRTPSWRNNGGADSTSPARRWFGSCWSGPGRTNIGSSSPSTTSSLDGWSTGPFAGRTPAAVPRRRRHGTAPVAVS